MTNEEVERLILEEGLTLSQVIDVIIKLNGIIGVGLINFAKETKNYIESKINRNVSFD